MYVCMYVCIYIWYIYIYIIYYIHAYICWISVREKSQLWQRLIVGTQPKSGKPTMNYTGTKVYHFWSVTNLWNKMKQTDTNSIRFTRFNPQSSDIRKVSQIFPLWCCYLYVCSKKQTTTMSTMLFSDCQLEEKKQENLSTFPKFSPTTPSATPCALGTNSRANSTQIDAKDAPGTSNRRT